MLEKAKFAAAWMVATTLYCVAAATTTEAAVAEKTLAGVMERLFGNNAVSVQDDGHVVKIEWQCPGTDEEEVFCIEGSMISYMTVMEAVRDKKLDVAGRTLNFTTHMHRHGRDGNEDEIVVLAATWDGAQLMTTDWKTTSVGAAIDTVTSVQADQNFPTLWMLGETCNGLYGNPPRFCALAKQSARR
jgi:hypothetical protein